MKEKANLARIRDNQRRSRARRKEYLQELEAKLRQCELQGIEASAEIQIAARRVADENKKLRGLLIQNGIGDESIEAFLSTSPSTDTMMGNQYGGSTGHAVQLLEQLLQTRKSCCTDSTIPPSEGMAGARSRDSSASTSTAQTSIWDMHQTTDHRQPGTFQPHGKRSSSVHQFMTPSSSASITSGASMGHNSNRGVPHHQRLVQVPRNLSPVSNPSGQPPQMYDFNSQSQLQDPMSYNPSSLHDTAQNHLQPYSGPPRSSLYLPSTTTASLNVNSCNYATEMITSMSGSNPAAVKADLGCLPDMDCEVDNHLVFDVMDRYTGSVGL
jgi:hypothetical protein